MANQPGLGRPAADVDALLAKFADGALPAFLQGLQQLGWTDGRNLRIDTRRGGGERWVCSHSRYTQLHKDLVRFVLEPVAFRGSHAISARAALRKVVKNRSTVARSNISLATETINTGAATAHC